MTYYKQHYDSPIGELILISSDTHLYGIIYPAKWDYFNKKFPDVTTKTHPILKEAKKQLDEYFAGTRQMFDLPTKFEGTDFQKTVWQALARIKYGETKSYKDQALFIKKPKAARAVGHADGLNPLSIVFPCHRVVGTNGALTGYAGSIQAKKWLLAFEAQHKTTH